MNPDPIKATEIGPGVTLATLDGERIGNAIVIREAEPPAAAIEYLASTGQKFWLIETDFGNRVELSDNEIHELFSLRFVTTYDEWSSDRRELISRFGTRNPDQ